MGYHGAAFLFCHVYRKSAIRAERLHFDNLFPAGSCYTGERPDGRECRGGKEKEEMNDWKNRILVIEDEGAISELLRMNLEAVGYEVTAVFDGLAAEKLLKEEGSRAADLALLDIMLPGRDGFELMGALKACGIPVIYLTAKAGVASKVKGLKLGAEDYMVKPFEVLELLARVEKVLERTGKAGTTLRSGAMTVDLKRHMVWENGRVVALKPMEFALLTVFLKNRNVVLGRDRLLDMVWGSDFYGETRTVDVHVANLRKKLAGCAAIRTIPKAGYMFEDDEI